MIRLLSRSVLSTIAVAVFIVLFAAQASVAYACTLVCNGDYDPISEWDSGVAICYGEVSYEGCDESDDDTFTGGGGGPPPAPTASLSATPSTIESGRTSRLTWSSTHAASCTINQGIGNVTPVGSGERIVSPTSDITYTLTCQDAEGRTASDTATIDVTPAPQPFSASCDVAPSSALVHENVQWTGSVITGSGGDLTWRAGPSFVTKICTGGQNHTSVHTTCPEDISTGDSCTVEGARCRQSSGCDGVTYTDPSGEPNAHTQYGSVTPYTCTSSGVSSATYSYSWTGTDGLTGATQSVTRTYSTGGRKNGTVNVTTSSGSGTAHASCSMTVQTPPSISVDLSAVPESIAAGASSVLTWAANNADVCSSDEFDTQGATSGTASVSPGQTTLYSILCTKGGTGSTGTYRYSESDVSDLACPITDPNRVYQGLPNCPVNPEGKACSSGPCKVNTIGAYPGICVISTDIYTCEFSGGSPTQTATDSATVTVSATLPNLTAGAVSPTTATFGSAQTFSATILNNGSLPTGAPFTALWQRATDSSGTGATDAGTSAVPAIVAGGNTSVSRSITLPPRSNPWYVRVCADKASGGDAGAITESSEIDNCGEWTRITDGGNGSNGISCQVSDATPDLNQTVTFTAVPSGSVNGPYSWVSSGGTGPNGSGNTTTRTYTIPGPYTMQVGSDGETSTCAVTVAGPACSATPDLTLTATPGRVRADTQTFNVSWEVENTDAASCRLTGTNGYNSGPVTPTSCGIPLRTISQGPISTQTVYTLTCGAESTTAIVNVIPSFTEF